MMRYLSKIALWLWGFKIVGDAGNKIPKKVFAVAPHTSAWDFPLGLLVRSAAGMKVSFVGKDSLFKPPFGFIFRWLGGYPVDRSKSTNFVQAAVRIFREKDRFALVLAPEGTRKKVTRLKTGFYYIAQQAEVPIILIQFDFARRQVVFSDPLYPTDMDMDMAKINRFFAGVRGFKPELSFDPK